MSWIRVSTLAETSGITPQAMLRNLKGMNRKVGGRLLRRMGDRGIWLVSSVVLVEIREAERARSADETTEQLGLGELERRLQEVESQCRRLRESHLRVRRGQSSTDSRLSRIERSLSAQTSFVWLEEPPKTSEFSPNC